MACMSQLCLLAMNIGNRDVAKGLPRVVRGCPGDVQEMYRGSSGVGPGLAKGMYMGWPWMVNRRVALRWSGVGVGKVMVKGCPEG